MSGRDRLEDGQYDIRSRKQNGRKPVTIAFLTDLHNCVYGEENKILLDHIDACRPDLVLCAGDMLVGKPGTSVEIPLALMRRLALAYPVYYANGNHEKRLAVYPEQYGSLYDEYGGALRDAGVTVLNNAYEDLDPYGIRIYGLDLERGFYRRFRKTAMPDGYLRELLGDPPTDRYTVLLAHNPLYAPEYAAWGADLVLSGHVHGGLIRIPGIGGVLSPEVRLFPKYCAGRYHLGRTDLIVSRGLGSHSCYLRINNPPELSVISLRGES